MTNSEWSPSSGSLARAQGCLLGQVAGDSLGSLVEFQEPAAIARRWPDGPRQLVDGGVWGTLAGQPTDDSELAIALARSIVRAGKYDPESAAAAYSDWYESGPFDCGSTTRQALHGLAGARPGTVAAACRLRASVTSQANGSMMRASPLGIYAWGQTPREAAALAHLDSALTHPHAVCRDSAAVFVVAIAHAIRSGPSGVDGAVAADREVVYGAAMDFARQHAIDPAVQQALEEARDAPPADTMHSMGWVLIALRNAFYRLLHAPTLEEGVVATVRCGGDTDTNGAIAGALLGAVHGGDAVPPAWREAVLNCRPAAPSARPRPARFWAVDVLDLARRMLELGR